MKTTAQLTATAETVISWDPCSDYPPERVHEIMEGKEHWTAIDFLGLGIPPEDIGWVVLRTDLIDEDTLALLVCDFVDHVLGIFEKHHPDDSRPRDAIAAKRKWVAGDINDAELAAAWDAAWDAAMDAAGDAARDAEYKWQLDRIREVLAP